MKKSRFTETQIVSILKEADAGRAICSSMSGRMRCSARWRSFRRGGRGSPDNEPRSFAVETFHYLKIVHGRRGTSPVARVLWAYRLCGTDTVAVETVVFPAMSVA